MKSTSTRYGDCTMALSASRPRNMFCKPTTALATIFNELAIAHDDGEPIDVSAHYDMESDPTPESTAVAGSLAAQATQ